MELWIKPSFKIFKLYCLQLITQDVLKPRTISQQQFHLHSVASVIESVVTVISQCQYWRPLTMRMPSACSWLPLQGEILHCNSWPSAQFLCCPGPSAAAGWAASASPASVTAASELGGRGVNGGRGRVLRKQCEIPVLFVAVCRIWTPRDLCQVIHREEQSRPGKAPLLSIPSSKVI